MASDVTENVEVLKAKIEELEGKIAILTSRDQHGHDLQRFAGIAFEKVLVELVWISMLAVILIVLCLAVAYTASQNQMPAAPILVGLCEVVLLFIIYAVKRATKLVRNYQLQEMFVEGYRQQLDWKHPWLRELEPTSEVKPVSE